MIPAETTPCFSADPYVRESLTAMFESTRRPDHRMAAKLCAECPFMAGCAALAYDVSRTSRWAGAPSGTWGGRLWVDGVQVRS